MERLVSAASCPTGRDGVGIGAGRTAGLNGVLFDAGPVRTGFIERSAIMSTTTVVEVVLVHDLLRTEAITVAGFLAGYCGSTRRSYATDLRLFSAWCHEANLALFRVRRAHLELFGRWMEERGRMRSTVARRLSTLASSTGTASRSSWSTASRPQHPSAQGGLRVPNPRPGPQRARCLPRPGRARLAP